MKNIDEIKQFEKKQEYKKVPLQTFGWCQAKGIA